MLKKLRIISLDIDHLSFSESLDRVMDLAMKKKSSYVCFANVHMTIEAYRNPSFLEKVNSADLVLPDGKPLAIACTILHKEKQERISGMDFTPRILETANEKNISVFIYGSTFDIIKATREKMNEAYPNVYLAGAICPPFKNLTNEEITNDIDKINQSGAHVVLVALGCPKQEKWMAENSNKINSVLLGIGGALPVLAGLEKRAPRWMQNLALEWIYRLWQQPRKLFARYFYTNSYFIFLLSKNWIKNLLSK